MVLAIFHSLQLSHAAYFYLLQTPVNRGNPTSPPAPAQTSPTALSINLPTPKPTLFPWQIWQLAR